MANEMTKQNSGLAMLMDLPKDHSRPISKAQFARDVGLTRGRITQLAGQGLPVREDGRIDRDAALDWMDRNLDPSRRKQPAKQESVQENPSLKDLKNEHEAVKVRRAVLAYDRERGMLVDREEVERAILTRARRERDAHVAWVQRTAPVIAAELGVDPGLMFTALDRQMREHLADLSNTPADALDHATHS